MWVTANQNAANSNSLFSINFYKKLLMSCQSTILEDLEGRRSVKLQEGENNELILSTSQNPQMMPESDSEVDDIPDSKPEETLNEGSVQSDGNDQTSPLPVTAEPSPVTTETTEATETTASDKQIDETSDESFILEFARLCANRPGERSWLTRIQRKLPSQMRPLFPLLLVFVSLPNILITV